MASIEQRGRSFRAVVMVGGKKQSASFDTRAQALAWAAQVEGKKAEGRCTVTVKALLLEYLDEVAGKTDTAKWNILRIHKWARDPIGAIELGAIVPYDVQQWINRRLKEVAPATARRELNLMSGAFNYAVKVRRWITVNPCHGLERPASSRPRNPPLLTPQQIAAIRISTGYDRDPELRTQTARVGACVLLALETGMRSGEILRLKAEDYWRDQRTAHVAAREAGGRKGSRSGRLDPSRNVPLTAEAMRLLDQLMLHPGADHIVGVTDANRDALWRKARDQAGLGDVHFHDFKHEAATRMSRFLDVLELSHAIGTKDIRLLRDTYYINDASRSAARLPVSLIGP